MTRELNTLLVCLASKGFKMTHKPHLAYTTIKYCPTSLKFMVHLLKNPCIKIFQPCQWNHFNLITFRNYAVSFFTSALCVCTEGKGAIQPGSACAARPSVPHAASVGCFIQTVHMHRSSGRTDPSCPVLFFATRPLLCKREHNVLMTGRFFNYFLPWPSTGSAAFFYFYSRFSVLWW